METQKFHGAFLSLVIKHLCKLDMAAQPEGYTFLFSQIQTFSYLLIDVLIVLHF